ncbi:putative immunity protein [Candidatus Enterococcus ferrettii]|uniref:Imm-5-like domain-containing protein n=1 Tax=Candidatus Enterococcus ferrettii TaxID=2815324 RepID=A0ABV0EIH3_9ENTE|nr:hypothetical protein [Enterococcus sp. 665A]MBO1340491.1 hypothetical protein [Enterococcus sp. 665A]
MKHTYSWNEHELTTNRQLPTKPKIKLADDPELRMQLEMTLEQLPHALVAEWALEQASAYLQYLDPPLQKDPRVPQCINVLQQRINGECSAHVLRQAGFTANELAQESSTDLSKYAARVFAQAIASGHMRGHALVSADYGIKVMNILFPKDLLQVRQQRETQLALARHYLASKKE